MYKIEKKPWGFNLTFGETMSAEEMRAWLEESKKATANASPSFGVFVDMRTLKPLLAEVQLVMQEGQKLYKAKGMSRSVVILASALVTLQFKKIAKESGIYAWERYIDSSSVHDWENQGIGWIRDNIDPDA